MGKGEKSPRQVPGKEGASKTGGSNNERGIGQPKEGDGQAAPEVSGASPTSGGAKAAEGGKSPTLKTAQDLKT